MATSTIVKARKPRLCDYRGHGCTGRIHPGERYQRSVVFPGGDSPYLTVSVFATCCRCLAVLNGPTPAEQEANARANEIEALDSQETR